MRFPFSLPSRGRRFRSRPLRGQALAEAALVIVPLALLAFLAVNVFLLHRAYTAATAAAYACAQHITQYPGRPEAAQDAGRMAARSIYTARWNALAAARFQVFVSPPDRAGNVGSCTVQYRVALPFGLSGGGQTFKSKVTVYGMGERWKARWP